jgi:hypothetical protein
VLLQDPLAMLSFVRLTLQACILILENNSETLTFGGILKQEKTGAIKKKDRTPL